MSCWPRRLSDRLKTRRPERYYQNARVFICEPESTKLLAAKASPGTRIAVVFGRDVLILAMAGYGLLFTRLRKFPPSVWGKISTFFQIAAALVVMGAHAGIPTPVTLALCIMILATSVSGLHYAWRGITLLRQTAH